MPADALYFEDIEVGDEIGPIERTIDHEQVIEFIEAWTGNTGPSRFTDREVAVNEGLAGPIVPGVMAMALMSRLVLTDWSPTVSLKKLDVVFRKVVPHDEPHRFSGIVTDKSVVDGEPQLECDVFLEDQEGTRLIIGKATVALAARDS